MNYYIIVILVVLTMGSASFLLKKNVGVNVETVKKSDNISRKHVNLNRSLKVYASWLREQLASDVNFASGNTTNCMDNPDFENPGHRYDASATSGAPDLAPLQLICKTITTGSSRGYLISARVIGVNKQYQVKKLFMPYLIPIGYVDKITVNSGINRTNTQSDKILTQLEEDTNIYLGDVISTGSSDRIRILLKDGTSLSLGENSSIELNEYNAKKTKGEKTGIYTLLKGFLRAKFEQYEVTGKRYQVRTKTAALGIRGTEVIVYVKEVSGEYQTFLSLIEGGPVELLYNNFKGDGISSLPNGERLLSLDSDLRSKFYLLTSPLLPDDLDSVNDFSIFIKSADKVSAAQNFKLTDNPIVTENIEDVTTIPTIEGLFSFSSSNTWEEIIVAGGATPTPTPDPTAAATPDTQANPEDGEAAGNGSDNPGTSVGQSGGDSTKSNPPPEPTPTCDVSNRVRIFGPVDDGGESTMNNFNYSCKTGVAKLKHELSDYQEGGTGWGPSTTISMDGKVYMMTKVKVRRVGFRSYSADRYYKCFDGKSPKLIRNESRCEEGDIETQKSGDYLIVWCDDHTGKTNRSTYTITCN